MKRPLWKLVLVAAALVRPAGELRAQPSDEPDDRAVVLRRLIFDVEARRRVLVRSRGELFAISADSVGQLFSSQVLSGDLPPDSIVPRALKVREMSDFFLQQIKRELVSLEASRGVPESREILLRWNGAPGTWSMTCQGSYPPEVQGTVDQLYMTRPPFASRGLHVGLYRGHTFMTALNGTVLEGKASGQQRFEMPERDFNYDVGTLVWDAQVTEVSPSGYGVEGAIVAHGALTYTGNDGSCRGRWQSP